MSTHKRISKPTEPQATPRSCALCTIDDPREKIAVIRLSMEGLASIAEHSEIDRQGLDMLARHSRRVPGGGAAADHAEGAGKDW